MPIDGYRILRAITLAATVSAVAFAAAMGLLLAYIAYGELISGRAGVTAICFIVLSAELISIPYISFKVIRSEQDP